jgi:hypothetical protein
MDLIVITVNHSQTRKKVKKYLRSIGLGDFIVAYSTGSSMYYNQIITTRIDSPFDNKDSMMTTGKTIFIVNKSDINTNDIIDTAYEIMESAKTNIGIAFSIPMARIFN